jgi:anti-anti-sigma factor
MHRFPARLQEIIMAEPASTATGAPHVGDETVAQLYVTARRRRDQHVVVTVHGEVDLSNISLFRTKLTAYDDEPWLVVDMSGVRFCGVVGARWLHTMAVQSSPAGQRFEVVTNPMIARMLVMTGLADDITYSAG